MSVPMHSTPLMVERVSLIFVAARRGDGSPSNPERTAFFYYSDDGELMACYDPINGAPDAFFSPPLGKEKALEIAEKEAA